MNKENIMPRRAMMNQWHNAEQAIYDAIQEVELMGASPELTDAVRSLNEAMTKVSDWVDTRRTEITKQRISEFEETLKQLENSHCSSVDEYRLNKNALESTIAELKAELKTFIP